MAQEDDLLQMVVSLSKIWDCRASAVTVTVLRCDCCVQICSLPTLLNFFSNIMPRSFIHQKILFVAQLSNVQEVGSFLYVSSPSSRSSRYDHLIISRMRHARCSMSIMIMLAIAFRHPHNRKKLGKCKTSSYTRAPPNGLREAKSCQSCSTQSDFHGRIAQTAGPVKHICTK